MMIFTQVPDLLFGMRYFRIGSIKLALGLMQVVAHGVMMSALLFQAFFRSRAGARFPFPARSAAIGALFPQGHAARQLPVCGRTIKGFALYAIWSFIVIEPAGHLGLSFQAY